MSSRRERHADADVTRRWSHDQRRDNIPIKWLGNRLTVAAAQEANRVFDEHCRDSQITCLPFLAADS
jgi:hypothetical protein